jgi:hypothetical protein
MGTVSSQTGQSKFNVQDDSILKHNTKIEKQSRILVSINSDNTVRISEGISIATQTPRDRNGLLDTVVEPNKEITPNYKESRIKAYREDKFVQTELEEQEMENVHESKVDTNSSQVVIPQLHLYDGNYESDNNHVNNEVQQEDKNDLMRRKEASDSEVGMTDYWTDTGVQTDDELTNYGVRIAWDTKSVDAPERIHQHLSKEAIKRDNEKETRSKSDSPEFINHDKRLNQDYNEANSPEENQTFQNTDCDILASVNCLSEDSKRDENSKFQELNTTKMDMQSLRNENRNEDEESNRVPEHNLPRLIRPFDQLSLERYGKYKVRLSSDKEKCIVSSAAFLETGDAILIDRSNQKVKFVDKTFQFISSYELPAKPWALCSKGKDIYVTMGNTQIQQLIVEDMILEPVKSYDIKGRCLGICLLNSFLAVGLQVGEICLLDSDGKKQGTIQLPTISDKPCNPWHLTATTEGNVLVTDSDACALFCVNTKSELIFTFKQLGSPRGTAVDSEGNILIAGRDKETGAVVTIVHKDEELRRMLHIEQQPEIKSRVLMTWEQLEFVPYCVCFRKDRVVVLGGIQESLKIMTL